MKSSIFQDVAENLEHFIKQSLSQPAADSSLYTREPSVETIFFDSLQPHEHEVQGAFVSLRQGDFAVY